MIKYLVELILKNIMELINNYLFKVKIEKQKEQIHENIQESNKLEKNVNKEYNDFKRKLDEYNKSNKS